MSKRTTRTESSEPSTPAPRKRKAASAAEPVAAAPKAPRLRKKTEPAVVAAPSNGHSTSEVVVSEVVTIVDGEPSYEQIATRAYFIALERGFQTDPLSDWLLAERELRTSVPHRC